MARHWGRSWARPPVGDGERPPSSRPGGRSRPGGGGRRERPGPRQAGKRSRWHALSARSLAGQVFLLQVVIVLLLVTFAVAELFTQARQDTTQDARHQSLAVAQTFANSPGIVADLQSAHPTALLQPRAEAARKASGVDFIVVTDTNGIRFTHPHPDRIGKKFVGDISKPLAGHAVTETVNGTIGRLVQAVVPVRAANGEVLGLCSAGITISKVHGVADRQLPFLLGGAIGALALSTAGTALVSRRLRRQTHGLGAPEMTRMYEHHDAVLHAVHEGVLIRDDDGRVRLANDEARRLLGLPEGVEGREVEELGLPEHVTQLLAAGKPVTDEVVEAGDRLLAVTIRSTDRNGGPPGSVATLRDSTELRAMSGKADEARGRLKLLHDASVAIGTTLDVTRTAQELTEVTVPRFADFATVDLGEGVLAGDESTAPGTLLRRVAARGADTGTDADADAEEEHGSAAPLYPVGRTIVFGPESPPTLSLASGRAQLTHDLRGLSDWRSRSPEHAERIIDSGMHSLLSVPLLARGATLGVANFWRAGESRPFEEDDRSLAEELAAHAALCIDNARRYTREHAMAVSLQHSLLPRGTPEQNALEVAFRYLPAQAGVGGDWFDVIPLSGARVALVVGDVVGHGLHAAATMGRLRTAVHNFASLDMPPDELLSHLDEVVNRIDQESTAIEGNDAITGATCLYATYDPVSQICTVARAGHPPPALVRPDGTVEYPDLAVGPPLGLSTLPFETTELHVEEGSRIVLYTDGLIEDRTRDIDVGLDGLRAALEGAGPTPDETCTAVLDAMLPAEQRDDIALLVARTRVLPRDRITNWDLPTDPAAVADVRAAVAGQLRTWGLHEEVAFTTELVVSELITNAIRHASGPIRVRLLLDRSLVVEVSDTSSTAPHLRYAASTDEGGRGLFLVAQFAERWGTRYTATGKIIWAEVPLA
ncbi:SpoIIE family protein phosphatase [Streptomyces sp. V4-01]|uniref:SpoIIE family protein phosphatase n=1 Tax=Actinacidiphila polyblastidii TaxID=3110430 RepID=A0ABU7PFT8_9ACTN|nr:SpoIIE family protein phosphatase [Streptomyces sp. V4-01]